MDENEPRNKNQIMETPKINYIDMTLLNTPRPQASSTVERKSILAARMPDKHSKDIRYKRPLLSTEMRFSEDSSLGIIENISSLLDDTRESTESSGLKSTIDTERELARKILQRCSEQKAYANIEIDKEDLNQQNLSNDNTPSTLMSSGHTLLGQTFSSSLSNFQSSPTKDVATSNDNNPAPAVQLSTAGISFEPIEINGRSSISSKGSEQLGITASSTEGISFNTVNAEIMAQFANEEFQPGSQAASLLLADEALWQQNHPYALPVATSSEKEYLNLSGFSGIIGETDLTIESCMGRKVSVGEFFRRKCDKLGDISAAETVDRPSFGFSVSSPKKDGHLIPLVDQTLSTETTSVCNEKNTHLPVDITSTVAGKTSLMSMNNIAQTPQDMEKIISLYKGEKEKKDLQNSVNFIQEQSMSLSSIAQAIQDMGDCTPRRLVDQLIMARKIKKIPDIRVSNTNRDTFSRASEPLPINRTMSIMPNLHLKNLDFTSTECEKGAVCSSSINYGEQQISSIQLPLPKQSLEPIDATHRISDKDISRESGLSVTKKDDIPASSTQLEFSTSTDVSISENQARPSKNVVVARNLQEVCICVIGVPRESDLEILNQGDRWITCTLSLHRIQGEKECIELELPQEKILIKPDSWKSVKVGVKISEMVKPIIAVINMLLSDMVTRSKWTTQHVICFVPEEPHIGVSLHSEKNELDFQYIAENSTKTMPITLENKNSVDIPIKVDIINDGPKVFSIDKSLNETILANDPHDGIQYLSLEPRQQFTANVQFKAPFLASLDNTTEKEVRRVTGKLIVQIHTESNNGQIIKEVPLVGFIGACKIETIDTRLPLTIPRKQSKPLNLLNSGTVAAMITAYVVNSTESSKSNQNFAVKPDSLLLQGGARAALSVTYKPCSEDSSERSAMVKVIAEGNTYFFPVIGEHPLDQLPENLPRCDTPQSGGLLSSPASPHASTSCRSGNSGRNSPGYSVSGTSVTGDVVPIQATHAALVWSSVKIGKPDTKEITIRNTSTYKVKIHASIASKDKNFKFLKERQTFGSSMILSLQGLESRTLSIVFVPNSTGAAAGKIIFSHYEHKKAKEESKVTKVIYLYGYGGTANIEITETFKDMGGQMWLSLGNLNSGGSLEARIKLKNTGNLKAYAKVALTPKAIYPSVVSSWHVDPVERILDPGETYRINLQFHPRGEDLAQLRRTSISRVGTLTITYGDEPTRLRIRRLYNKLKRTGQMSGKQNDPFRNVIYPICKAFPEETAVEDLNIINDTEVNTM
ncbi:uncharacterized protein LOC105701104 isoform X1 [Orussus abietinus]|uniref:uncharacterized protein LOC105701104 isoform X1 n=2 Tax=Orussus abietinus TaxID=222816 RepID=UPI000C715EB9|nr:uncharacterized protein LOC105701104 isoform X1 [Orussus abietinus]